MIKFQLMVAFKQRHWKDACICVLWHLCVFVFFFCIYMYSLYLYEEQLDNDKGDDDDEPVIDKGESGKRMKKFGSKGHIEAPNLKSSRPEKYHHDHNP